MFGENNLSNKVVVEKIIRYPLPFVETKDLIISGVTGRHLVRNSLGVRTIQLIVRFIEDTYEAVQERVEELAPLIYSKTPQKLELRDTDLFNYAIVESVSEVIKHHETAETIISFACYDPFNYGELRTINLALNTSINNPGFETDVVFELITMSTNDITLKLNNGHTIRLTGAFNAGGSLIIDTKKELVTLNGNIINRQLDLTSDFFKIPSGASTIQLTGASGVMKFNEVYL